MSATDNVSAAGLTNDQVHAFQKVRDALPGVAYTVTTLRERLVSAWEGTPDSSELATELHARLEAIRTAIEDAEKIVAPYVDQTPVEKLGLPVRAVKTLREREGIRTVAQLGAWPECDLADIPGIGDETVREIKARLRKRGITLPPSPY